MTQYSNNILETDLISDSREVINNRDSAIKSNNSGIEFPTVDRVIGMNCYIIEGGSIPIGKYVLTQLTPSVVWKKIAFGDESNDLLSTTDGGTGASTESQARINLGIKSPATTNILPVSMGGTNATTSDNARGPDGLGIALNVTDPILAVEDGGTGSGSTIDYLNSIKADPDTLSNLGIDLNVSNTILGETLGGTGASTSQGVKNNLGIGTVCSYDAYDPENPNGNTIPILNNEGKLSLDHTTAPNVIYIGDARLKNEYGLLCYPIGNFDYTWPDIEIKEYDRCGIYRVYGSLYPASYPAVSSKEPRRFLTNRAKALMEYEFTHNAPTGQALDVHGVQCAWAYDSPGVAYYDLSYTTIATWYWNGPYLDSCSRFEGQSHLEVDGTYTFKYSFNLDMIFDQSKKVNIRWSRISVNGKYDHFETTQIINSRMKSTIYNI